MHQVSLQQIACAKWPATLARMDSYLRRELSQMAPHSCTFWSRLASRRCFACFCLLLMRSDLVWYHLSAQSDLRIFGTLLIHDLASCHSKCLASHHWTCSSSSPGCGRCSLNLYFHLLIVLIYHYWRYFDPSWYLLKCALGFSCCFQT